MAELETEILKLHREVQNKYTYLLMAVAGSAIALSLKRTTGLKITYSMIPLALAVLSWGFSFFCGYRYLRCVDVTLFDNLSLLVVQKGTYPEVGNHPEKIAIASEVIKERMEDGNNQAVSFSKWQFRWLVLGALFFIGWHIIGMIELTLNATG